MYRAITKIGLVLLFSGGCGDPGAPPTSVSPGETPVAAKSAPKAEDTPAFVDAPPDGRSAAPPTPRHAPPVKGPPADAPRAPQELYDKIDMGDLTAVKSIIDGGVNVNAVDKDGFTPLHWAPENNRLDIVNYLIAKGADVNAGTTKDRLTPLHLAVAAKAKDIVRALLDNGAIVNVGAESGITPLLLACDRQNVEIATILLEKGASPAFVTKNGLSPLQSAVFHKDVPMARLLIKYGADVNATICMKQPHPNSPLAFAAWRGNDEVTKLLLSEGARDPWLSRVPGFDPYDFQPLDASKVGEEVRVSGGSSPWFMGAHLAKRPWVDPKPLPPDTTGTNFLTWTSHDIRDAFLVLYIDDEKGHRSRLKILLPSFFGDRGVHFHEGVTSIGEDGPFVTVRVIVKPEAKGKVQMRRKSAELVRTFGDKETAVFELSNVAWNEPITIEHIGADGVVTDTVAIDCIGRGASPNTVFIDVLLGKP